MIASGGDPAARIVYDDGLVVGFTPPRPATLGHTLLIPRHHVANVWALDRSDAEALARATLRVADGVRAALSPEGLNVVQSNGEAATQTVDHLHVHIVPRWASDDVGEFWPETTNFSAEEKLEAFTRLRNQLNEGVPTVTDNVRQAVEGEDRRKHLEFVQAVVTRMSASSATAKGWLLPVVTATYGFAIAKHSAGVAILGIVAALLFALMDANYLRQEKAYRRLYDTITHGHRWVPLFSLDPSHADDPIPPAASRKDRAFRLWRRWVPEANVWVSWSIAPFYATLLVVGLAAVLRS
ncbi:hypothetical protein BH18ACT9_BH18ACT9_05400 [soil metagenome]